MNDEVVGQPQTQRRKRRRRKGKVRRRETMATKLVLYVDLEWLNVFILNPQRTRSKGGTIWGKGVADTEPYELSFTTSAGQRDTNNNNRQLVNSVFWGDELKRININRRSWCHWFSRSKFKSLSAYSITEIRQRNRDLLLKMSQLCQHTEHTENLLR